MRFRVIDNKTGKEADPYEIALHEEWAQGLVYCDMEGFMLTENGDLMLADECGTYVYCDPERFKVVFEDERPHGEWKTESAIDYLTEIGWLPEHDRVLTKTPQWIPCSERLPNDDDYKPYLNYTEAVWFCTSDGAIGIGWYYKSTNEWEAFGDIVLRGKVVAWMPLPEPYKREGEANEQTTD